MNYLKFIISVRGGHCDCTKKLATMLISNVSFDTKSNFSTTIFLMLQMYTNSEYIAQQSVLVMDMY